MIPLDLSGKVALVTGASGELGRTIARTLAAAGADVAVHYFHGAERAAGVVKDIESAGRRALAVQADVTRLESVMAMRDAIGAGLGAPHIVVAGAVAQYPWTSILEQAPEDYESQFRSCVLHNVHLIKAFIPEMVRRRAGRYIGINTECTMMCLPGQSAYISGKAGMDRVLRVLAREVGAHQVTVNQVAPGWMISDRQRGTSEENQPGYQKSVPMQRRGYDQDIANTIAFLASDLAQFISGVYLPVCGGNVMPAI